MKVHPVPMFPGNQAPLTSNDLRPPATGLDLAALPGVRAVLAWRGFPDVLQATLLLIFIVLAVLAWGVFTPAGVNSKLFAKSNLVTLLIWGLWWPAMVWGAVLLGRVWCLVCPLELLSRSSETWTRRLGFAGRPLPGWITGGTLVVVFYFTLQLLVAGIQLHRTPGHTAGFLVALLTLAVATGVLFRDRAFCRGFCPVGLLLGTYGRGGIIAVRPGTNNPSPAPDAHACPTRLNPARLDSNRDCLVCCHCIKTSPPGSMRLLLRRPFCATDARPALASWPVTVFVMIAFGFVTAELCTEWPAAQRLFLFVPKMTATALPAPQAVHWLEAAWTLAIVPLGVWLILAGVMRALGRRETLGDRWRSLALPMAVVVAAGHMAKGLAKFVSWAPFLPHALREPEGAATAIAITQKSLASPTPLIALSTVGIVGLVLIVAAVLVAIREHRLARRFDGGITAVLPYGLVGVLFGVIVAGWTLQ